MPPINNPSANNNPSAKLTGVEIPPITDKKPEINPGSPFYEGEENLG